MDLAKLDFGKSAEQGADLHLRHPTTDEPLYDAAGKPITIRLAGVDSAPYRKARAKVGNRRLAKRNGQQSFEQLYASATEILAESTLSWQGIEVNGKALEFSTENALKLYSDYAWIREQVDEFIGDRAHFLPTSSKA